MMESRKLTIQGVRFLKEGMSKTGRYWKLSLARTSEGSMSAFVEDLVRGETDTFLIEDKTIVGRGVVFRPEAKTKHEKNA